MNTAKNRKLNISFLPLSILCGLFTGFAVFLFKFCATYVIRFSKWAYTVSAQNPIYIPLFVLGITFISVIIYFILKTEPQVKGGGIPTAVKFIREGKAFNVIKNIFLVPISALLTFLSGVPLGNEGPSVQLGCAIGDGVAKFSKKNISENRANIMSAGACAGFGVATGAPLSGILFSVEEIKGKLSYKLIFSVIISTLTAAATARGLCYLTGAEYNLFHIEKNNVLPIKYIWIPLMVGLITGLTVLFHRGLCVLYDALEKRYLHKIKLFVKIEIILLVSAVLG
ncbi:MAG: chloride channel protein, partial [Clostridia bacterium]|nr:chloride channel protein [Clostridia bacterium]